MYLVLLNCTVKVVITINLCVFYHIRKDKVKIEKDNASEGDFNSVVL